MKNILLLLGVLAIGVWAAWHFDYLPFQDSKQYVAFQEFATALVRGDIATVERISGNDDSKKLASKTYLAMHSQLRDVHRAAYRLDRETVASGRKQATLTVSQQLTADPVGVTSAFGTVTCQGQYEVTMDDSGAGWKVSSLTIKPADSQPPKPRFVISLGGSNPEWPCADSPWTTFATSWKEKVMGR